MPLQNRVTPAGDIVATSARGTFMGNRGILHDDDKRIVRTSRNTMWLICRLEFKGRRRPLMRAGTYTELFFLDEAVALAAGHRPCGECRRAEYRSYTAAVNEAEQTTLGGPKDLDRRLNDSRRAPWPTEALASLPDGVFVALGDEDFRMISDGSLHRWSPAGYVDALPIDSAGVEYARVMTPTMSVGALRHGYRVEVHPTARQDAASPPTRPTAPAEEQPLTSLTPELLGEIRRHLRANPMRHGEVYRAMEQGLDVDQMNTGRGNARNFTNSVEAMLAGALPTTRSAALVNSYGYRLLLGCDLSPALRRYTEAFLDRLHAINPAVNTRDPLQIRALPGTAPTRGASTRPAQSTPACAACHLIHAGDCD